jgi:nucleoside-diphosphate kinase
MERTFGIIKPDAVAKGYAGAILAAIEETGFKLVGFKKVRLSTAQARAFYEVHKERPFYNDLVKFMTDGPVVVMVLEKENAIADWRKLMGATNPEKADAGTLRKRFAENIERNAVHGSDGPETAAVEIPFFFTGSELL